MTATRLRGGGLVLASLAVHAVAIVGVSMLALRTPVAPLFVDLTQDGQADSEARPGRSAARSSRSDPSAGGAAPARRASPPSPSATRSIVPALPVPRVTESPPDPRGFPTVATPTPPPPVAVPSAPAPSPEQSAPAAEAVVDRAPAPVDSTGDVKPSAADTRAGGPPPSSGSERTAGAVAETGGDAARSGVSATSGARLALALPGAGRGEVPAEYGPYLARFRRRVEDALVYPLAARRQGLAGRVELDVLLEPSGHISAVEVHLSSSHRVLDEAGIAAVRSLPPMPFPELLPRRPLRIRLPLDFQLR